MQTYSHFIITAAVDRAYKDGTQRPVNSRAFLLGSVLPDVPLLLLTIGYFIQSRYITPNNEFIFGPTYDNLYFTHPLWIIGHSLFHAPLLIMLYAAAGYFFGVRRGKAWGRALLWFALGCALHSAIDIPTHRNDGPLLFFPFDWRTRFESPISYWDSNYYGREFAVFEHVLDLLLIVYLVGSGLRRRRRAAATE